MFKVNLSRLFIVASLFLGIAVVQSSPTPRRALPGQMLKLTRADTAEDAEPWFSDIWELYTKQSERFGVCTGELTEDDALDLLDSEKGAIKGTLEVSLDFISGRNSGRRCEDSEDSVSSLEINYVVSGSYSGQTDAVTVDARLKKCEEDGGYHVCDSTPRNTRFTVRRSGDSVVLEGTLAGVSKRTLNRHQRRR